MGRKDTEPVADDPVKCVRIVKAGRAQSSEESRQPGACAERGPAQCAAVRHTLDSGLSFDDNKEVKASFQESESSKQTRCSVKSLHVPGSKVCQEHVQPAGKGGVPIAPPRSTRHRFHAAISVFLFILIHYIQIQFSRDMYTA